MSSDELKVPSQRNDVRKDDEVAPGSDPDTFRGSEERERVRAEEARRDGLTDDEELVRGEAGTERLPRVDDEQAGPGPVTGSRDPHVGNDENADNIDGVDDIDDRRRGPRADDEHAAAAPAGAVPGAAPVGAVPGAADPAGAGVYDDAAGHRDPYARTDGDMLAADPKEAGQVPAADTPAHAAPDDIVLFDQDPGQVQARWRDLQAAFVDDPGQAVQRADGLVGEVVESLTSTLTTRTNSLRDRWKDTGNSDTEQLRLALREYRSVLERLLALSSKSPTQPAQYQSQEMR
ncbi:hypothetical protein AB0I81_41270 [Nonomuraea sp. NPDC050404]|uniref:hypothetical protein n=1 Tax=Nonomuraea sp. NPDC050404 TaxID=3155783 RepID=UPI0033FAB196